MVCAFIAAAVVLRPNSSLAGVLGSSGLASAGNGRGLRLPLSCASADPPMVDTSKAPRPRVVTCVFSDRRAIMGNLLGFCLAIRRPGNANAHPNATPEEYVRLLGSQLRPVGAAGWPGFGEFPLIRET